MTGECIQKELHLRLSLKDMRTTLLSFLLLFAQLSGAQERYYTDPLKIPLLLSASFAELRANHFHSGIDIKTQGTIGLPVYAVADGYVSRIAVSPSGFGNALYINHPNGTTSVYGHLDRFSPEITKYIRNLQYEKESFRIDVQVPAEVFPVKQGEEIAKSGNTGSSGGPHLHFEIRDTKTEEPLNPLDLGFSVTDNTPPKIFSLLVVPLSDTSHVDFQSNPKSYQVVYYDGSYHLKNNPAIPVYGELGFAIQANDYFDGTNNKCGINALSLNVNGETQFTFLLNRFSFDYTRYINSHIDYEEYIRSKRRYIKTWIDPGNLLPIYNYNLSQGIVKAGEKNYQVQISITDSYGNKSTLEFNLDGKYKEVHREHKKGSELMKYNEVNGFEADDCSIEIPLGALYKDIDFSYSTKPTTTAFLSDFQYVGDKTVPLQKAARLKIRPRTCPPDLESKLVLVNVDSDNGTPVAVGGDYKNGWVETNVMSLGTYAVMADTLAPVITSLSIDSNGLKESNRIRFRIRDDLSGIDKIVGLLDGKWALFEYDAKTATITHVFDKERFEFGKRHSFQLTVSDYRENSAVYKATFWK